MYGRGRIPIGRWVPAIVGHAEESEEDEVRSVPKNNVGHSKSDIEDLDYAEDEKFRIAHSSEKTKKFQELKRQFEGTPSSPLKVEFHTEYEEEMKCGKCKKPACYYWHGWEDGKEYKDFPLCSRCRIGKTGISNTPATTR